MAYKDPAKQKAQKQAYRKANKETIKVQRQAYYKKNREKLLIKLRVYAETHREEANAYAKAYRKAHLEKIKAKNKAWRLANKEKQKAYHKVYCEVHRKEANATSKAWRKANPDKMRTNDHKRRARERKVPYETIDEKQVYLRDGWICQHCKKKVNKKLKWPDPICASLDHIVPLIKGGRHIYSNVQLAHLSCNASKKANILLQGEQTRIF